MLLSELLHLVELHMVSKIIEVFLPLSDFPCHNLMMSSSMVRVALSWSFLFRERLHLKVFPGNKLCFHPMFLVNMKPI
jgi:hypothetical protein